MAELRIGVNPKDAEAGAKRVEAALNRVRGSARGATRGVKETEDGFESLRRRADVLRGAMVALAGAAGFAYAAKKAFDLGAAVEETGSKFRTVFGDASSDVERFGDEFATMAGLSRREFQDLTATVGQITQGFGFATAASAEFSEGVVRLAGDFASFNNASIEESVRAIKSALVGQFEPMDNLGVVIRAADVNARALADTSKSSADALTQQEKATATLALITERAGVVVGDLDRTQDSAANRARALEGRFRDMADAAAAAVVPALSLMVEELLEATDGMGDLANQTQAVGGTLEIMAQEAVTVARTATNVITGLLNAALGMVSGLALQAVQTLARVNAAINQLPGFDLPTYESEIKFLRALTDEFAIAVEKDASDIGDAWSDLRRVVLEVTNRINSDVVDSTDTVTDSLEEQNDSVTELTGKWKELLETLEAARLTDLQVGMAPGASGRRARDRMERDAAVGTMPEGAVEDIVADAQAALAALENQSASTAEKIDAASRTAIGLADNLGLVDGAGRDAIRAISDIIGSLASLRNASGDINFGSVVGIAGGVVGVLNSIFSDDQARRVRDAAKKFEAALDTYVDTLTDSTRWESLQADAEAGAQATVDALYEQFVAAMPNKILQNAARDIIAQIEDLPIDEQIEAFKGFANEQFGADAQRIIDAYIAKMERIEELRKQEIAAMEQSIEVEMLRAQGMDEAADALERQIAREKRLADAAALDPSGGLEALLEQLFAVQDAAREAAEAEAALAEARRQAARRRDFMTDFQVAVATGAGDDLGVQRILGEAQIRRQIEQYKELVEAGTISQSALDRFAETLRDNLTKQLDEAAEAARRAAEAEKHRKIVDLENLRVRLLVAQGLDDEAAALRRQIELMDALHNERSDEYIALLRQVHAAEIMAEARQKEKRAMDETAEAIHGVSRALNAPQGLRLSLLRWRSSIAGEVPGDGASLPPFRAFSGHGGPQGGASAGANTPNGGSVVHQRNTFGPVMVSGVREGDNEQVVLEKVRRAVVRAMEAGGPNPLVEGLPPR